MASLAFMSACSENSGADEPILPVNEISVSADLLEFASNGTALEENSVVVTSSSKWRLSGKMSWCVPSSMAGESADAVQFTVEPNPTADERLLTYTFICGDKIRDVVVKQAAGVLFEVVGEEQEGQPTSLLASSAGEMLSVKMFSNVPYTYDVSYDSGSDWLTPVLTRAIGASYLYFDVAPNDSYDARTAKLTLRPEGGTPKEIRIVQALKAAIVPEQDLYEIGPDGGNISITVRSNVDFNTVISTEHARWITKVETRGLTGTTMTFNIASARAKRSGIISFVAKDGSVTTPVTIQQEGPAAIYANIVDPIWRAALVASKYVIAVDGPKCEMTESGLTLTYLALGSAWSYTDIKSIEGIAAFSSLTSLNLNKCNLTKVDLSGLHNLTNFNAGNNPLAEIHFGDNKIQTFDSQYGQSLYNYNTGNYASSITITGSYLQNLYMNDEKFRTLDVTGCPNLKELDCGGCPNVTAVKVKRGQTINFFNSIDSSKIVYVD